MKPKSTKAVILAAALVSIVTTATAQTTAGPIEVDLGSIQIGSKSLPARLKYNIAEALTDSRFSLTVVFTGNDVANLQVDSFELQDEATTIKPPVTISIETSSTKPTGTPGLSEKATECRVKVTEDAPAQSYRFKMMLSYPGQPVDPKYFDLPIWPKTASKAPVIVDKKAMMQLPLVLRTNQKKGFDLPVRNDFNTYKIYVKEVTLTSVPPGLIEAKLERNVEIPAEQTTEVPIEMTALSPDAIELIKGFSQEPQLLVKVTYQDEHGRSVRDLRESIPIKIIPSSMVLISAIVIGVIVGTFVRFYLEFLARKRKIQRREVLKFVLYTAVFGLIVAAVALAGQIEIKALDKPMGSYDKPLAMFIIGLAAAIGGVQLIVAWYSSLRPKGDKPDA